MATTAERLQKVRDAIDARIDGGAVQSYTLDNGVNIQKCSLTELMALEKRLADTLYSESRTLGRSYAKFTDAE